VLALEVQDKPGGLHEIIDCLTRHGINVENSSGYVANNRAVVLIEVKDVAAARKILAGRNSLCCRRRDAEVVSGVWGRSVFFVGLPFAGRPRLSFSWPRA